MSIVQDYITHGLKIVAIPPGVKGPNQPGWNTRAATLTSEMTLPPGYGVGLAHAYSGTMALDIDDWARTLALGIDVDALYAAPDSVTILSGKTNHGKLLYRMPFGMRLPSKQLWETIGKNEKGKDIKTAVVNFRCGTVDDLTVQDVLPPSIHPETQLPYQWGGNGHWTKIPMIPLPLLDYWQELLKDIRPATVDGVDSSWDEIREALAHISPDCSREDWVQAGMALKWAGEQTYNPDQAFAVWDGWSKQSATKYPGANAMAGQWRSFRSEKHQVVTLGTLFHLARESGWTRATPDASTLFADVSAMVKPEDVLETMKAAPPEINLDLWPPLLAKRAEEVSIGVGCDPVVPLFAGLAAVCGVVDARSRLELMPGFKVPPVLWLMTIGDPGDRKSPGSRPMLAPLTDIELADKPRYAAALTAWEFKNAIYASAHKAVMKFAETPEALLAPELAPPLPAAPVVPIPLKIKISDITSQELVYKSKDRPRGMLAYFDEMNHWTNQLTNRNSGENRSAWVVGFESEPYEMDRVSTKQTYCENFALSIYGNMQPQVLQDNFTGLAADGLLQRFLPAIPHHNKTRINQIIPEFMSSAGAWHTALCRTYAIEARTYKLDPEAFASFRRFQEWYEDRMKQERLMKSSNEFITAFAKITGLVGRLALVFHILEAPWNETVTGELMDRVIRVAREYVIPVLRHVFDTDGSAATFDSWVMDYIIQHSDYASITMSKVKRAARRPLERASIKTPWQQDEWVINAMALLEKMNWVARIDDGSREGKGHAEWLISPHLKTTFAAYREAVVKAKLARHQDRHDKAGIDRAPHVHGSDIL